MFIPTADDVQPFRTKAALAPDVHVAARLAREEGIAADGYRLIRQLPGTTGPEV